MRLQPQATRDRVNVFTLPPSLPGSLSPLCQVGGTYRERVMCSSVTWLLSRFLLSCVFGAFQTADFQCCPRAGACELPGGGHSRGLSHASFPLLKELLQPTLSNTLSLGSRQPLAPGIPVPRGPPTLPLGRERTNL